jgi:hypothetical protein
MRGPAALFAAVLAGPVAHRTVLVQDDNGARKVKAHEALDRAITGTLVTVTSSDAQGWFRHCGYALK